jgi:AcrR family transcriptional regulator
VTARSDKAKPRKAASPSPAGAASPQGAPTDNGAHGEHVERYRRLPTGGHGLAPEEVERDQRKRLQTAIVELTAERGYQAVRIADVTKLAHVSRPTLYSLYADKEELLLSAYEDIASRTAKTALIPYETEGSLRERLEASMRAFCELSAAEPQAMSLFLFGAFGAGPKALERRNRSLEALERSAEATRDRDSARLAASLTVKLVFGGIREVTAARLLQGRASELPGLVGELTDWETSYPRQPPVGLQSPSAARRPRRRAGSVAVSERARHAEGRLPSGRHDLPRELVVKSQRERIVDATAAIVAEKGLAGLTIPEIAARASVSHETFYEMYPTKQDAVMGAQKVGMHQALRVGVEAYEAHKQQWSRGVAEGLRALIAYLCSEPAHAHLSIVDTFAASPETLEIRAGILRGFAVYLSPGERPAREDIDVPAIAAEAVVGGIWQVLHHYVENNRFAELLDATPQLIYLTLTPFLGSAEAAEAARRSPAAATATRPRREKRKQSA